MVIKKSKMTLRQILERGYVSKPLVEEEMQFISRLLEK